MASRTCCPYTQQCTATRSEHSSAVGPKNWTGSLHGPAHSGSQPGQLKQGAGANPADFRLQGLSQTALPAISQLLFASPSQLSSNGSRAKRQAVAVEAQAGRDNKLLSAVQQVGVSRGGQPARTMSDRSQVAGDASQQFTEAPSHDKQVAAADLSSMQASEPSAAVDRHSPQHLPWPCETATSRLNCSHPIHQGQPRNELQAAARYAGDAAKHSGSQHSESHLLAPQRQAAPASPCTHPAAGDRATATASSINQLMAPISQRPTVSQQQARAGGAEQPGLAGHPKVWGPAVQPAWNGIVQPSTAPQPALPQQQLHPPAPDQQKSQHSRVTESSGHRATSGVPQHAAVDGGRSYQQRVAGGGPKSHSCSSLPPSSGAVQHQAPSNSGGAICQGLPQDPGQGQSSGVGSRAEQAGTLPLHPVMGAGRAPQERIQHTCPKTT